MKTQKVVNLHSLIPAWIEHLQPPWGLNLHSKPIQIFSKQWQRWGQQIVWRRSTGPCKNQNIQQSDVQDSNTCYSPRACMGFPSDQSSSYIWAYQIWVKDCLSIQVKRRQRKPQLNHFTKLGQWAQVEGRSKPHSDKRSEDCMSSYYSSMCSE